MIVAVVVVAMVVVAVVVVAIVVVSAVGEGVRQNRTLVGLPDRAGEPQSVGEVWEFSTSGVFFFAAGKTSTANRCELFVTLSRARMGLRRNVVSPFCSPSSVT